MKRSLFSEISHFGSVILLSREKTDQNLPSIEIVIVNKGKKDKKNLVV